MSLNAEIEAPLRVSVIKFNSDHPEKKRIISLRILHHEERSRYEIFNRCSQYLNCKIFHGGRFCSLDQTHSECESALMEFMSFRPRNRVKTKKKGLHRNLGLKSAGICGTYSCCQALFRLFNQRSNLDGGTLNLDWGTLTLDGGTCPSYNSSTGCSDMSGSGHLIYLMSMQCALLPCCVIL